MLLNPRGGGFSVFGDYLLNAWCTERGAQDGGWYVQCRYGARPLLIDGKNNAVFVQKQAEISGVLAALVAATAAGELDAAMAAVTLRKRKQAQP